MNATRDIVPLGEWPYRVALGPRSLGFADVPGNRNDPTLGHLSENPRSHLFLMDDRNRCRVTIRGKATLAPPTVPGYRMRAALQRDVASLPGCEVEP